MPDKATRSYSQAPVVFTQTTQNKKRDRDSPDDARYKQNCDENEQNLHDYTSIK